MLFNRKFKVIEVFKSGLRVTHYLEGSKKNVKKDIEYFKGLGKDYEMISNEVMIVWR